MNGSERSRGTTASVVEFRLTVIAAIAALVYLSMTAYTKDGLWFWPSLTHGPAAS